MKIGHGGAKVVARIALGLLILGSTMIVESAPALAGPYDISLRGVGRPQSGDLSDPAVVRYRNLGNELATALSPKALAPAETLGMNGFEFSLVSVTTPISWEEAYWQGQPGTPVLEGVVSESRKIPKTLWTPTLHIRKGLPLSTELGISGSYLWNSEMFSLGADLKIAIHESFFRWAPAVTARISFSRLFGSTDFDIVTGEADVMTSLPFGIAGMAQLTPYLGYGYFFAHINSGIIDDTPYSAQDPTDQAGGPDGSLYNFPTIEWDQNQHVRIFGGMRFIMTFIEVTYEYDLVQIKDGNPITSHSVKVGFDV